LLPIRIPNIKKYILCVPRYFALFSVSLSEAAVFIITLVQILVIVQQTPDGANGLVHSCQSSDRLRGEYRGLPVLLLEHGLVHLVHDALVVLGGVVDVRLVVDRAADPVLDVHAVVTLACASPLAVADEAEEQDEDEDTYCDDDHPPGEGGGEVDAAGLTPHHLAQAGVDLAVVAAHIPRAEATYQQ